jgi:hypothetical protein
MSEPIQPKRLPYLEETQVRWRNFSDELLAHVPELECATLILTWTNNETGAPAGIAASRHGGISTPGELIMTMRQLGSVMRQLCDVQAKQQTELENAWIETSKKLSANLEQLKDQ